MDEYMYDKSIRVLSNLYIIGVIGDSKRNLYEDYKKVRNAVLKMRLYDSFITVGGDREFYKIAEIVSINHAIPVITWPPDWTKHKNKAVYMRNNIVLRISTQGLIICCHKNNSEFVDNIVFKYNKLYPDSKNIIIV